MCWRDCPSLIVGTFIMVESDEIHTCIHKYKYANLRAAWSLIDQWHIAEWRLIEASTCRGGGGIEGRIKYAHHFTKQLSLELVEPRMCAIFALSQCIVPGAGVNCFCTADLVVFPINVSLHMLSSTSGSLMKQMVAYSCLLLVESRAYTSSSDTLECSV